MGVERLYYADAYCARFSARIIERLTWQGRPAVILDRTAFYPTSGGQPADRGTLRPTPDAASTPDEAGVLDVMLREADGAIIHVLDREIAGAEVEGALDWARRFDHMQQHTGQHILSASFERLLDADTVGFHLGSEITTVDIARPRLDPAQATQVEELANQVVWENRPLHIYHATPEKLAALALRRPLPAEEMARADLRIVEIADFDANPCGGTHVAQTGEIGAIKITRLEYRGQETRVEFRCGRRALHDYRVKHELLNRLAGRLTVGHGELEQAVERLLTENNQLWRDLRQARRRLLEAEARELAAEATPHGPYHLVRRVWAPPGRPPDELRALAQELARRPGSVALLAGVGERVHLCFARADDAELDMSALLREACAQLGGKGGGQPHLAQGSAPLTDTAQVTKILGQLAI